MSSVECLREFVNERLTAAAEEIFRVFKQTVVKYEEEIDRQRRLLDIAWKPEIHVHSTELPQQHDCKVEEVLADQQFCSQKRTSSLDQEEPEPPQIKEEQEEPEPRQIKEEQEEPEPPQVKEEQEELCISQEGEQLVVKQETDIFMMTPTDEESDHNEPELKSDHQLLSHSCHIAEGQDQKGGEHGDSGSTRNAVPEPESQHYIIRSYNVYNSTMSKIHCNIHTGVKPFKCNTCGKAFKYKSQFYTHVRIHTGEKPYFCKTCGKRFSDSSTLKSHLTIHTDEKPHTCKTCGKGFRRSCGLKRHLRTHTGERPYVCNTCEKRFCEMSQLKTHMITHTGEKPYPCNICGKRFSRTPDLKRHTRIHTGERAFTSKTWKDFQT